MSATLAPQLRSELVGKVEQFLLKGTSKSEIADGLSQHLQKLNVSDYVSQADSILGEAAAKAGRPDDATGFHPLSDGPSTFFESIATPLIQRGWKVAPCYPKDKTVHTKLVPEPLRMISKDPAQIHAWGLAEPNANVCVYAEQVEGGACPRSRGQILQPRGRRAILVHH